MTYGSRLLPQLREGTKYRVLVMTGTLLKIQYKVKINRLLLTY